MKFYYIFKILNILNIIKVNNENKFKIILINIYKNIKIIKKSYNEVKKKYGFFMIFYKKYII